uniref:Peptidase M12B domain-containing protein n=1 Tax=Gallus gallus TaxID=9031 RepID=Q5F3G5_CHICK|nr:hypothetical protein RCJMB04_17j13 [Gallus gallus]
MNNVILIFVVLLCFLHQGSARKKLLGVEQYEIVYPRKLHTVHKRDAERSKEETKYDDTLEYGIKANGEEVILHLQKNKHLLAGDYTETVYSDDGQQITTSPQIKDHCYYEGYIQDEADSTASIRACKGLSGYFETRGQKYLIEPLGTSDRDKHAVYEFVEDNPIKTCGVVNSSWEVNASSPINSIFKSSNSPEMKAYLKAKKYLEVYVVADNTMYKKYNKDVNTVRQRVFGIVNFINTVYKAVNIYVALIGLEIWTDNDKCSLSPIAGSTLDNFSKWRNSDLLKRKRNDNAQLITGHDLEGTTIGLAFIKSICSDVYSAGIIQDHSRNEIAVGATMAHEMGHNLGMSHDTKDCMCHSRVCIMTDTVSSIIPKKFSSCSLQDFEKYMLNDMPKCLTNEWTSLQQWRRLLLHGNLSHPRKPAQGCFWTTGYWGGSVLLPDE